MVDVRTDRPTYVAEPPVIVDPQVEAWQKNPNMPWTLSPEFLQKKNPQVTVEPRAGQIYGGHVVSQSVYTEKFTPVKENALVPLRIRVETNDGNAIEGVSFFTSGVVLDAPTEDNEMPNTNMVGRIDMKLYDGIPFNGVSGTTGWEITSSGRKWRTDLVPISVIGLFDKASTVVLKPESGTYRVESGLQ